MELIDILFKIDENINNWIRIVELYQHYLKFAKEVKFKRIIESNTWKFDPESFIAPIDPNATRIRPEPLVVIHRRFTDYKQYFRELASKFESEKSCVMDKWVEFDKDAKNILGMTFAIDERNSILVNLASDLKSEMDLLEVELFRKCNY